MDATALDLLRGFVSDECKKRQDRHALITLGTVTRCDEETCTLEREDRPTLYEVRLNAVLGPFESYLKVIPKTGSTALCALIENDPTQAFIVSCSEFDRLIIKHKSLEVEIKDEKISLKNASASLGGIIEALFEGLTAAVITTPSGPGGFSPNDRQKFMELKNQINRLFL